MILKKKTPLEKIKNYINKNFSNDLSKILNENIVKKIELDWKKKQRPYGICSKWAGFPDLPKNIEWPKNKLGLLDFIVQINLEEFKEYIELLPKKGMISIFVDLKNLFAKDILNKEKIKLIYSENIDDLIENKTKKLTNQEEYKFEIVKSYSILPSDSPKLTNLEMNDDEYDCWEELNYDKIDEFVGGGGYICIGKNINDRALSDWTNEKYNETVDDYFSIFELLLDVVNYNDCWLEIGILKKDLKQLNFENIVLAIY